MSISVGSIFLVREKSEDKCSEVGCVMNIHVASEVMDRERRKSGKSWGVFSGLWIWFLLFVAGYPIQVFEENITILTYILKTTLS